MRSPCRVRSFDARRSGHSPKMSADCSSISTRRIHCVSSARSGHDRVRCIQSVGCMIPVAWGSYSRASVLSPLSHLQSPSILLCCFSTRRLCSDNSDAHKFGTIWEPFGRGWILSVHLQSAKQEALLPMRFTICKKIGNAVRGIRSLTWD